MKVKNLTNRGVARLWGGDPRGKIRCGLVTGVFRKQHDFITSEYAMLCILSGSGKYIDKSGKEYPFEAPCILQRFPNQHHSLVYREGLRLPVARTIEVLHLLLGFFRLLGRACPRLLSRAALGVRDLSEAL